MFAAAFAAITSDTFGSEIGVLDDRTYLITTNTPSTPSFIISAPSAGVATPPAAKFTTGSGIFKSPDPIRMVRAIVEAVENYDDYRMISNVSTGLSSMEGKDINDIPKEQRLAERGI